MMPKKKTNDDLLDEAQDTPDTIVQALQEEHAKRREGPVLDSAEDLRDMLHECRESLAGTYAQLEEKRTENARLLAELAAAHAQKAKYG